MMMMMLLNQSSQQQSQQWQSGQAVNQCCARQWRREADEAQRERERAVGAVRRRFLLWLESVDLDGMGCVEMEKEP